MLNTLLNGLRISLVAAVLVAGLCLTTGRAMAQTPPRQDRTAAPYFYVEGEGKGVDQLPLKGSRARVNISGVIAEVNLSQRYRNEGKSVLEAVYVFPASSRAAIHLLKMRIGDREIVAKVQERDQAKLAYETARGEGRTAALLTQERPNVFQMQVANILPGDEILVELAYTEILTPSDGMYQFVLPTVVGPRYVDGADREVQETWQHNPYLPSGRPSPFSFGLELTLTSTLPVRKISCPSHQADVRFLNAKRAEVRLPESAEAGTRDFVLDYSLAGEKPQSGLILHEGKEENFFLWVMEPPAATAQVPDLAREYIFVLDVSGSMQGFPLQTAKELMTGLLRDLGSGDSFNILFFAGDSLALDEKPLPVTPGNVAKAVQFVQGQRGGGGTRLLPALRRALSMPAREGACRSIVLVTDGYVDVEKQAFDLVRSNVGQANLFVFGVGTAVNRYLLEGLARAGQGEARVVLGPQDASAGSLAFRRLITHPALRNIRISTEGFVVEALEPAAVPDLFAGRSLMIVGKYRGKARGRIVVRGQDASGEFRQAIEVGQAGAAADDSALPRLWARKRIEALSDLNRLSPDDERVSEVLRLGLAYNLLTDYTSFVAIDTQIRRASGEETVTVRQPLPLPSGVPNSAVGPGYAVAPRGAPPAYRAAQPGGFAGVLAMASPSPGRASADMSPGGGGSAYSQAATMPETAQKPGSPKAEPSSGPQDSLALEVLQEKVACRGADLAPVLERLRGKLDSCRGRVAARHGRVSGEFVLKIAVGPDGRLSAATAEGVNLTGSPSAVREMVESLAALGEPSDKPTAAVACVLATIRVTLR